MTQQTNYDTIAALQSVCEQSEGDAHVALLAEVAANSAVLKHLVNMLNTVLTPDNLIISKIVSALESDMVDFKGACETFEVCYAEVTARYKALLEKSAA